MRRAFALAVLVAALAGCGGDDGDDGYPQEAVDNFVTECAAQPGSSEDACRCIIEELRRTMPYDEFERADQAVRENRAPAEDSAVKIQAAADGCR